MTKKDAIKILEEEKRTFEYNLTSERSEYLSTTSENIFRERVKALEMAIQALEQEPKTDNDLDMKLKLMEANVNGYTQGLKDVSNTEQEPCEDAISRQAVLSYIYNDLGLGDEENGADIERQIELEDSYRYVKSLPPVKPQVPKWIPVSEKLPEERKSVLVYAPEYNNIYCTYLDGDTWFIFGGYGSYAVANVTAWMPLPIPYKGEQE